MRPLVLHNVTIYVEESRFEPVRSFYGALAGGRSVWEQSGHIACFGTADVAVCVHEVEPGRVDGARELFFWVDDVDRVEAELVRTGIEVERMGTELHCVDPVGNQVRVHSRRENPAPRIDVLVPVSDVRRACAFYAGLVGLAAERMSDDFATLKAGAANLWLHREDDGLVDISGVELWIGVDDVDEVHRRFVEAGLPDLRPPNDVAEWGLRVTSAPDPDGRRVYLSSALI